MTESETLPSEKILRFVVYKFRLSSIDRFSSMGDSLNLMRILSKEIDKLKVGGTLRSYYDLFIEVVVVALLNVCK